jgi:hypothetical protein
MSHALLTIMVHAVVGSVVFLRIMNRETRLQSKKCGSMCEHLLLDWYANFVSLYIFFIFCIVFMFEQRKPCKLFILQSCINLHAIIVDLCGILLYSLALSLTTKCEWFSAQCICRTINQGDHSCNTYLILDFTTN